MSRAQVCKTLERKYAAVLGEFVAAPAADNADSLKEALAAIQIVIRLWEPDWLPDHIKPIRPKQSYATHGIQSRLLFEFIGARTGSFTAMEAAEYVSVRLEALGETIPPIENIKINAHNLMRKLESKFVVSNNTRPETWTKINKK
ncbi:MAG: hypothetical protein NXI03_00385 [Alphaproteobacteria bacterium]|uniref:hypothetical protein n=1 Tax=Maricaulis alexandrii TaxID=2570354 RepID=UPI0011098469|nr:hypothetical protein [Maricaulis alexandrii]MCR9266007.1 hypothetical protein [Alphaproteobacteria bacterium]